MRRLKGIALVLAIVMVFNVFMISGGIVGSAASGVKEPKWDQAIIDEAVKTEPVGMSIRDYAFANTLYVSEAMYILALMSYFNPDLKSSDGVKVSERLLDHFQMITKPGKAPSARGALGGWVDNPVAQAIVLAKHTPAVWGELTLGEKERLDFIMHVLTVSANYHENYVNHPKTDFSQTYDWSKSWNPNHQEGCVGIMIAAYIYFEGADNVNKIFEDFSYDAYIQKMDKYGFDDMKRFFETTGKKLIEEGGTDKKGGTVEGVKVPFTYKSLVTGEEVPYNPLDIYKHLAAKMYSGGAVRSQIKQGEIVRGYIADGSTSPFEGMEGMAYEFASMDAEGIRTDAGYVNTGWRNSVPTRATLEALGIWDSEYMAETERLMYVGSEDFLYKISPEHGGYMGYQKGKETGPTTEESLRNSGFFFYKEIWKKFLKRDYTVSADVDFAEDKVTATYKFDSISPIDREAKLIMAVYDEDGKLTSIEAAPFTVKLGKSQAEISAAAPSDKGSAKLFYWNAERGMQLVE